MGRTKKVNPSPQEDLPPETSVKTSVNKKPYNLKNQNKKHGPH